MRGVAVKKYAKESVFIFSHLSEVQVNVLVKGGKTLKTPENF